MITGGWERRTIKATEVAGGLGFPHAVQALQVHHTVTRGGRRSVEVAYLVTSMPMPMPMVSAAPLQVAAWVRGHWAIENRLHWVRDVTFGADCSAVRTCTGPQVMATIRTPSSGSSAWPATTTSLPRYGITAANPHRPVDLLHAA